MSACNVADPGLIPGLGFLPGESHRWRSMVGYSPWGHKESDTMELHFTSLHFSLFTVPFDHYSFNSDEAVW